jgi:hypothetical protein
MKKYYKIEVYGSGGEYTLGTVAASDGANVLKEYVENDELAFFNDSEEYELDCYSNDDIFHVFGGEVNNVSLLVTEIEKPTEDSWEDEVEIKKIGEFDGTSASVTGLRNPYIYDYSILKEKYKLSDDSVILGGYAIEKASFNYYIVETENDFDINNFVIGVCNLDESLVADEIIDFVYYIEPNNFIKHMEDKISNPATSDKIKSVYKSGLDYIKEIQEGKVEYYSKDNVIEYIIEFIDELKEVEYNKELNPFDIDIFNPFPEFLLEQMGDCDGYGKHNEAFLWDVNGNALKE